jgi:hypothetical protein
MRRGPLLGILLVVGVALSGCGDPKHPAALQGTWRLTDASSPQQPQAIQQLARKLLPKLAATMVLKEKGELSVSQNRTTIIPGYLTLPAAKRNGTWEVEGQNLKLTAEPLTLGPQTKAAASSPSTTTVAYTIEGGGKTLKFSEHSYQLTWTKQ